MNQKKFQIMCQKLRLEMYDPTWYNGVVSGWPLTIENNQYVQVRLPMQKPSKDEWKQMKTAAKGKFAVGYQKNTLTLNLRNKILKQDPAAEIMQMIEALYGLGLVPDGVCPICKQGACDTAAYLGTALRPAHRHCLQDSLTTDRKKAEDNEENGSILLGILGAFLGMLVGILPSFLTTMLADRIYAVLFTLIPIGAYFGYKLLKGKMNRTALAVSIVMTVIGVYFLCFASASWYYLEDDGLTMAYFFPMLFDLMSYPENWLLITTSCIIDFIFAGFGVFLSWRFISGTSAGKVEESAAVLEHAIPWQPGER